MSKKRKSGLNRGITDPLDVELPDEAKAKPRRSPAPRRRKRREPPAASVQHFPQAGELIRKTIYLSREEWDALEDAVQAGKAQGATATAIVRRALRAELGLEDSLA